MTTWPGGAVTAALLERGALVATDGVTGTARRADEPLAGPLGSHPYRLGSAAPAIFGSLGVDVEEIGRVQSARPLLRFCVDWTEQRHHLAGRLGAAVLANMTRSGWLVHLPGHRALQLTDSGAAALRELLNLDVFACAQWAGRPHV